MEPNEQQVQVWLRVSTSRRDQLQLIAKRHNVSMSTLINMMVTFELERSDALWSAVAG